MSDLTDERARERINTETGSNLFVEAGAGSGKTHSLVQRVARLVVHDGIPLDAIAAVTFTEKAGAELRDRLREELEDRVRDGSVGVAERERAEQALDALDVAAIGTLHSFAQRILSLHPIEAGLPPLVEVLDEVASSVAFEERWAVIRREMLDDEDLAPTVQLALAAGIKLEQLRSLTRALGADWDLIEDRVLSDHFPAVDMPDVRRLVQEASRLAARASECSADDDKFLPRLAALSDWGARLAEATTEVETYLALLAADELTWGHGKATSWAGRLTDLRTECKELQAQAKAAADAVTEAVLRPLTHWLGRRVVESARIRAANGRLEFHDLLVIARRLLRDNSDVRAELQERFPRILLDEFQDTDPIQIELAVRIVGGRHADAADWHDVVIPKGSLFVVGDPKQSIYRFRRADIAMYLRSQGWFGDHATAKLTTNFRTVPAVLAWVNEVFSTVIRATPDSQPAYETLQPHRAPLQDGPAVRVLGADEHPFKAHGNADLLRQLEAKDVATVVRRALDEGWQVVDERTGERRAVEQRDIALLIPARTSLPALETALDNAGIPYRAESSSLVYQAPEVHDLLVAARVVADPSDYFSCVVALRSPLFGCGDDDLWTWKHAGGSFNILAPTDPIAEVLGRDHPVAQSLDYLRRLHYRARWMTPSEVLGALVADRRVFEVAVSRPRTRDLWRRLRFVIDQARAWSEVEHGGLRAYLAWAAKQGEESSRMAEAVLPETDVDAVRIMTVHAAKGLEFPLVVLSGLTSQPMRRRGVQLLWPREGGYSVRLTSRLQTNDFEDVAPVDEQMDAYERRRLLYVATTRARDHLVVSLHRGQGPAETNARLLADAGAASAAGAVPFVGSPGPSTLPLARQSRASDLPAWEDWYRSIEDIRARTRHDPAQSASGLEGTEPEIALDDVAVTVAGSAKGGRDTDLLPWAKGRYGSAIGRAVHGVLQAVDLATGQGLEQAVASQCLAEGVVEHAGHVEALVRSALNSEIVRRAAPRPHWRESYVGMVQDDGTVLEGYVDLMYREDDGSLVIVDYKTDHVPAEAVEARTAHYRPQMNAYKAVLQTATEKAIASHLLFLIGADAHH